MILATLVILKFTKVVIFIIIIVFYNSNHTCICKLRSSWALWNSINYCTRSIRHRCPVKSSNLCVMGIHGLVITHSVQFGIIRLPRGWNYSLDFGLIIIIAILAILILSLSLILIIIRDFNFQVLLNWRSWVIALSRIILIGFILISTWPHFHLIFVTTIFINSIS